MLENELSRNESSPACPSESIVPSGLLSRLPPLPTPLTPQAGASQTRRGAEESSVTRSQPVQRSVLRSRTPQSNDTARLLFFKQKREGPSPLGLDWRGWWCSFPMLFGLQKIAEAEGAGNILPFFCSVCLWSSFPWIQEWSLRGGG